MVKARASCKAAVYHHAHPINGQAGLGNVCGENDFAAALRVTADRKPLGHGINLPMQPVYDDIRSAIAQNVKGAVNLTHAGQECQYVALLFRQRLAHYAHSIGFNRQFGPAADIKIFQRPSFAFAFHHRRIVHQY